VCNQLRQTRRASFSIVEDAVEGIVLAAERYNQSELVNRGSAFEISVRDLVETTARLTGFERRIVWGLTII
jgi:GDP-L-fucose synthase